MIAKTGIVKFFKTLFGIYIMFYHSMNTVYNVHTVPGLFFLARTTCICLQHVGERTPLQDIKSLLFVTKIYLFREEI